MYKRLLTLKWVTQKLLRTPKVTPWPIKGQTTFYRKGSWGSVIRGGESDHNLVNSGQIFKKKGLTNTTSFARQQQKKHFFQRSRFDLTSEFPQVPKNPKTLICQKFNNHRQLLLMLMPVLTRPWPLKPCGLDITADK